MHHISGFIDATTSVRKLGLHLMCTVVLLVSSSVWAQEPQVIVQVDRTEVYEGESILYRVTLNHFDMPKAPELMGFDDFQVESLGDQSLNSTSITIINGRRTEVVRRGQQYNYRLRPLKTGTLTIPAPTARIGNDVLRGRTVTLRVMRPQDQDTVIAEVSLDRKDVYPMQPFRVTLNLAVKDLPGRFAKRNPLGVQQSPPALQVPWLDDDQLPKGLTPEKDWRSILEPALDARGEGFQINNIGQSSAFSLFGNRATAFQPNPIRTRRKDKNGQTTGYWEYRFTRTIIPRKVGTYQFGPATVKGMFATRAENDRLIGEKVYAVARPVALTVKSVPAAGRPDSFIGAVGQFEFQSELIPMQANVGDPMTLTLTLTGQGTLDDAAPPDLSGIPEIAAGFKTYEATTETDGNSRRFTYSLRPLRAGQIQFPEVPVSYFDVEREQYVTLRSTAIPIEIGESERLSNDQIVANPRTTATSNADLQASESGLFANDTDWRSLRNETVHPMQWTLAWSGMIGCYLLATLAIGHVRRRQSDPAMVRRRKAAAVARHAIETARKQQATMDEKAICQQLRSALANLVADVTDTGADGITPRDVESRLVEVGVGDELADKAKQFFEMCDAHRYGDGSGFGSQLMEQASALLEELLACMKMNKVLR